MKKKKEVVEEEDEEEEMEQKLAEVKAEELAELKRYAINVLSVQNIHYITKLLFFPTLHCDFLETQVQEALYCAFKLITDRSLV